MQYQTVLKKMKTELNDEVQYYLDVENDFLIFGSETKGLAQDVRNHFLPERCLRLPMRANSRSLNLSNSVAVMIYEAWRQMDFKGGE